MFCCKCGALNPDNANYCHRCGVAVFKQLGASDESLGMLPNKAENPKTNPPKDDESDLLSPLALIDPKPHTCHRCGTKKDIYGWDFALGMVLSTRRSWGQTAWSVAVSAVTLPTVGYGGLELPGKVSHLRVVRMRLILCSLCKPRGVEYSLHPWWSVLQRLGFTRFLGPDDLDKLQPER